MLPSPNHPLIPLNGSLIYYQGPTLGSGPLPAVIFFALSGRMSLFEDPFNQPVLRLAQQGIRVFSWDLPFHGPNQDPHKAMHHWAHEFIHRPSFLTDFLEICEQNIYYLIDEGIIDPNHLAVAGLSRGGFIATHLAARLPQIQVILGFAPLTQPQPLEELKEAAGTSFDQVALTALVDKLIHRRLRFYMGNRDMRVGTDFCYHFIRHLTEAAFNQGIRSPQVELILYPSVGHNGHGTPPFIFHEGADWMKRQLVM